MKFAAALSEHPLATHATGEVLGQILESLGEGCELACVFVTAAHGGAIEDITQTVRRVLRPRTLIASTAVSVMGGRREVEEQSGVALWAAELGAAVQPVRLEAVRTTEGVVVGGLPEDIEPASTLLLLADPFSLPVEGLLEHWAGTRPGVTVVGGLASAARGPGGNRLVLDGAVHTDGAVGVIFPPSVGASAVVSQGCRPIGDPMIVTRAERQVMYELAGQPALARLLGLLESLGDEERELAERGIHLGRVIDESKVSFERGDFLIRNVLGGDREAGSVAVGDEVPVGSTVQFQVRDASSADEDLRALLSGRQAAGALVFTCNGRGIGLFGRPDHDAEVVSEHVEGRAVGGMFCAGELGPVGSRSFLHGFTASVLLFAGR